MNIRPLPSSKYATERRADCIGRRISRLHRWQTCRRGTAALEFAVFLPFLMVMLMVLFTIAGVPVTHIDVTIQSRHKAWTGRHQPWKKEPHYRLESASYAVPRKATTILGDSPILSPTQIVAAEQSHPIPIFYLGFQGALRDAKREHFVLGGSWDHQEINFPTKSRHRTLTPVSKFYYFTNRGIDFSNFRNLASLVAP